MRQHRGYILFELVIGVSLLSLVLLGTQQWFLYQRQQQQRQIDVTQAKLLLVAVERFWLHEKRIPNPLEELVQQGYLEQLWLPWQDADWLVTEQDNLLRLSIPAGNQAEAQWLKGLIVGATLSDDGVFHLHVWKPIALVLQEHYLQRFVDPLNPEVNTMMTDLIMGGHAIKDVGNLEAAKVTVQSALIQQGNYQRLKAARLDVENLQATQALIDGYSVADMAERLQQLQQQWQLFQAQGGCQ